MTVYRCPRCGGSEVHAEVTLWLRLVEDEHGDSTVTLDDFEQIGTDPDEHGLMQCDDEDCQFKGQPFDFVPAETLPTEDEPSKMCIRCGEPLTNPVLEWDVSELCKKCAGL